MAEFHPEILDHPAVQRLAGMLLKQAALEESERNELRDALEKGLPPESGQSIHEAFASLFGQHLGGLKALRRSAGLFRTSSPSIGDTFNISAFDYPFFVPEMILRMRNYFSYYGRARLAMFIDPGSSLFIWGHTTGTRHAEIVSHFADTPDGGGIPGILSIIEYLEEDALKLTGYRGGERHAPTSLPPSEWKDIAESISDSAALRPYVSALTLYDTYFEIGLDPKGRSRNTATDLIDRRRVRDRKMQEPQGEKELSADLKLVLINGLHARTIARLIDIADRYDDEAMIFLQPKSGPRMNQRIRVGNSAMLSLVSAGLTNDNEIRLSAQGPRAAELLEEASAFVTGREMPAHNVIRAALPPAGGPAPKASFAKVAGDRTSSAQTSACCRNGPSPMEHGVMSMHAIPFALTMASKPPL